VASIGAITRVGVDAPCWIKAICPVGAGSGRAASGSRHTVRIAEKGDLFRDVLDNARHLPPLS
jgi:hypothetical protein